MTSILALLLLLSPQDVGTGIGITTQPLPGEPGSGEFSYAMHAEGAASEYLNVPHADQVGLDMTTGSFTWGGWMRWWTVGSGSGYGHRIGKRVSNNNGYEFYYTVASANFVCAVEDAATNEISSGSAITCPVNTWCLVVCVVDRASEEITLYINAVPDATPGDTTAVGSVTNTGAFDIARRGGPKGDTDAATPAVWNKALSGADVTSWYASGTRKYCTWISANLAANLVECWDLDEESGDRAPTVSTPGNILEDVNTVGFVTDGP